MRVFVTGASGFVGSAIVKELIGAGHQVLGLARSDKSAAWLEAAGAEVHRGDLQDLDSLKAGAAASDAVIHTAFIHDFSKFKESTEIDRGVIQALGEALADSDRPLVITSGIGVLASGKLSVETDLPPSGGNPRVASEEAAQAVAALGGKVAIVRLPPTVHDKGDAGFIPMIINMAREKGVSVYKGEGLNRWPAVHRLDAARLYRLVVEQVPAGLSRFHAVAEEGIPFRDIATMIGKRLNIPFAAKSPEEAAEHFGWFSYFASLDVPSSAKQTAAQLGWQPVQPGLIADLEGDSYFVS